MSVFLIHILKSSVCLALFYLCYRILLSKETFHRFNRLALLGIMVLSFLLPFIEVTLQKMPEMTQPFLLLEEAMETVEVKRLDVLTETPKHFPWSALVFVVYASGILFFLLRHAWSMGRMLCLLRTCRKEKREDGITLYVHRAKVAPFSWMKKIAISEDDLAKHGEAILAHEQAHIRNGHSWDLLLVQACVFLQWFNPAAWLLKKELQIIHEYEADEDVICNGMEASIYQLSMIEKAVGTRLFTIANSFNHGLLNKRITMMNKERSHQWACLKYLFVLPLSALVVVAFAQPPIDELKYSFLNDKGLSTTVEMKRKGHFTSSMKDSILVVVNEKVKGYGEEVLSSIPGEQIESILTVHSNDAVAEYGDKAKHGVIKITTKGKETLLSSVMDEFKEKGRFNVTKLASGASTGNPLIVIDGEVKGNASEILKKIEFNTVKSMVVLQNHTQTRQLYGDMAKDGVIVISTINSLVKDKAIFSIAEEMPEFPGGMEECMKFISKNTRYPAEAHRNGIHGKVVVHFLVTDEGEIKTPTIIESVDPLLDAEALRVIKSMPKWKPGRQRGKAVNVVVNLPVTFNIQ